MDLRHTMSPIRIRIPIINIEKIRAARANRELTRTMQKLLSGIDSPYRRINWSANATSVQSQSLPKEVAASVQQVLSKTGLKCSTQNLEDSDRFIIVIQSTKEDLDIPALLSNHSQTALATTELPEEAQQFKELAESISSAWNELSKSSEDIFNILRDAPPIIIQVAEKMDELFIGMKSSTTKRSTSESAVLSSVYYTNLFINLLSKSAPDLFRFAFKKTPVGPIFIAGYQLADDLFYARKWVAGREEHQSALISSGQKIQFFSELYESLATVINDRIDTKIKQLQDLTKLSDQEMSDLVNNAQTQLLLPQPVEASILYQDIIELKDMLKTAEKTTKELTTELRKKGSRLNTAQQVMMTTKHINRAFNITFIALGIAAFFFPPLAIPATIIAVAKGATSKKLEDRIRTATQIVQGIYDIDDHIVLSAGKNKTAINKSKTLKAMNLEYAPVAILGAKLGIRQKNTYERTKQLIHSNPEYTLYIPETFSYKQLDVKATRREIRGQVDAYSLTCRQLIFHLGIIQGRDLEGNLPVGGINPLHPPHIHNINEIKDLINDWSENLIQQIQDQQLNPPRFGKNSYFCDAQIRQIRELHSNAINFIDSYQNRINALDRQELDQNARPIQLSYFDMNYAKNAHKSIIDEIIALRSILDIKKPEQRVKNADSVIERLENRIHSLMNYCDKYPDKKHQETFNMWKEMLEKELSLLKKNIEHTKVEKKSPQKTASEKLRGIEVEASDHNQLFVTVHHARGFESRKAIVDRLKERISENQQEAEKDKKTELVLLPVTKVSNKALFHYKGDYWKMMWMVRGVDRAIESVEITLKNKESLGAEINPKNVLSLLEFYKKQLEKINDYSGNFTFSKTSQSIVKKRVEQALDKVNHLIADVQHQMTPPRSE